YSGGAEYVISLLRQTPGLFLINETSGGSAFHRVSFRSAPHNPYSSTTPSWAKIGSRAGGVPAQYFQYSEAAPAITPTPSPPPSPSPAPSTILRPGTQVALAASTATYPAPSQYDSPTGR